MGMPAGGVTVSGGRRFGGCFGAVYPEPAAAPRRGGHRERQARAGRLSVAYYGGATSASSSTRRLSSLLDGSIIRAATSWANTSSPAAASASPTARYATSSASSRYPIRIAVVHLPEPAAAMVPGGGVRLPRPRRAHFRRSNYATRVVRPAADGWYPERKGPHPRQAAPVLVDMSAPWPGVPLPPWPPAVLGEPYSPPVGRGIPRLAGKEGSGRCPACGLTIQLRRDGTLVSHKTKGAQCAGTGEEPAEPLPVASWLPLRAGLTPHGCATATRHG